MGKWKIGTQVVARDGTILVEGIPNDPDMLTVEPGAYGIIVGSHGTDVGIGGRFERRLSIRFSTGVVHGVGSSEVLRLGGALGDVTPLETADARVADAVAKLDAVVKGRDLVVEGRW